MINIQQYEVVFIINPTMTDDVVKETVEKFEKVLKENNAEIVVSHHWGLRKLAYPIQKKNTGYYHLFEFRVETSIIAKLEIALKRDEKVMRFLTVRMDKFSIAYADRKRNRIHEPAVVEHEPVVAAQPKNEEEAA